MTGNEIIDPCFTNQDSTEVACPNARDPRAVVLIQLTATPDTNVANHNDPQAAPWLVQLQGGVTCGFLTGATTDIAGRRYNYECSDGSVLYGNPDESHPLWQILRSTQGSAEQVRSP